MLILKADEQALELAGLGGSEVEELDTMLQQAAEGQGALPADMEQRVAEAATRAAEERKRDYVMEVVAAELENLGYVVAEEFETASTDAPQLVLRKPGMAEDYHVSLSTDADTAQLEVESGARGGGGRPSRRQPQASGSSGGDRLVRGCRRRHGRRAEPRGPRPRRFATKAG